MLFCLRMHAFYLTIAHYLRNDQGKNPFVKIGYLFVEFDVMDKTELGQPCKHMGIRKNNGFGNVGTSRTVEHM